MPRELVQNRPEFTEFIPHACHFDQIFEANPWPSIIPEPQPENGFAVVLVLTHHRLNSDRENGSLLNRDQHRVPKK